MHAQLTNEETWHTYEWVMSHIWMSHDNTNRPRSFLEVGFRPCIPSFVSKICTINSELKYFLIFTQLGELGLISAGFQRTGPTPAGFQEAFCAVWGMYIYAYIYIHTYIYIFVHTYIHTSHKQVCRILEVRHLYTHVVCI